jgi:fermentation-respiration switch protein FrsA (DUF1100 family)
VPIKLWPGLKKLPPVLVVHGAQDDVVPVSEAYALIGFCKEKGLECVSKIYEKEGHLFKKSLEAFGALKAGLCMVMGKEIDESMVIAEGIRKLPRVREAVLLGVSFFKTHLK